MAHLATAHVIDALDTAVARLFSWHATDPAHPYHGALIDPATGIDDPGHGGTTALLTACCYLLLARQQPMASDLRTVVAVLRIVHELERSADLMVNVAKTTRRLYPHSVDPKLRGIIQRMGEQAGTQTRVAIDAFADADPSAAAALADMDDTMDDLTKSLFRYILGSASGEEETVLQAVQLALVGRHYERIADHSVTIAQRVGFMVTGEHPQADDFARKGD